MRNFLEEIISKPRLKELRCKRGQDVCSMAGMFYRKHTESYKAKTDLLDKRNKRDHAQTEHSMQHSE